MWRNSDDGYGWVAIILHWLVAAAILGLFGLGLWMVDLTYYDPWYRTAPDLHRSIGVLLFAVVIARLAWRWVNPRPRPEPGHMPWERRAAAITHGALYALLLAVTIAGYLISTAKGQPVEVFELFHVPATVSGLAHQEDIAGDVHAYLAWALIALTALHALAALKHHFVDRDGTLRRVLRPGP